MQQAEEEQGLDCSFEPQEASADQLQSLEEEKERVGRRRKLESSASEGSSEDEDIFDDNYIVDKLPEEKEKLRDLLEKVQNRTKYYKQVFLKEERQNLVKKSPVGDNAIPICADVTKFNFEYLLEKQLQVGNRQFDVIMMDPPWKLSTSQPSRGVAIQYCSLNDEAIENIPVPKLQNAGFLFVWVINAKYQWTVQTMQKKWGYKVINNINWVKKTVNGKIAKGHGFYLQHAKESCVVGIKGDFTNYQPNLVTNVIFSERRGQSQKPTEIYEYIEALVPKGYYLEIFGRRNNLRNRWVTIGNQL